MIESFGGTLYFAIFIISAIIVPGFYSFRLIVKTQSVLDDYKADHSGAFNTRFAGLWVLGEAIVAVLILISGGPEGQWAYFVLRMLVFIGFFIYGVGFYYKLFFTFSREMISPKSEIVFASAFQAITSIILVYGMSSIIYA